MARGAGGREAGLLLRTRAPSTPVTRVSSGCLGRRLAPPLPGAAGMAPTLPDNPSPPDPHVGKGCFARLCSRSAPGRAEPFPEGVRVSVLVAL